MASVPRVETGPHPDVRWLRNRIIKIGGIVAFEPNFFLYRVSAGTDEGLNVLTLDASQRLFPRALIGTMFRNPLGRQSWFWQS